MTLKDFFENPQLLAINLKTKEQADIFIKEADKLGKKWLSGASYVDCDFWGCYKGATCCDNQGLYSDILYYGNLDESRQCKVLKFEDIEWEKLKMNNFTKKDIKNGAIVETRNGQRFLKIDKTLLNMTMDGSFIALDGYYDNLKYSRYADSEYDIMKILNPHNNIFKEESCNLAVWSVKKLGKYVVWTWERKEKKKIKLKEMTVEQYKRWKYENCFDDIDCEKCPFNYVNCREGANGCWVHHKDIYNETFLNQEIYLED